LHVRLDNGRTLRAGANVVQVSKLVGHSSIVTTQRFVHRIGLDERRAVVLPLPVAALARRRRPSWGV
jgi:hypothetical protein